MKKFFKRFFITVSLIFLTCTLWFSIKDSYLEMPEKHAYVPIDNELIKYTFSTSDIVKVPTESYITGKLAIFNDLLIKNGNKYSSRTPVTAIGTRIFAITLFPIAIAADSVYASSMYAYHKYKEDPEIAEAFRMRIKKDLLGLIATPTSLLSPDLVTNHFIPVGSKGEIIRPYGKLYSIDAIQVYPKNHEEVREILHIAKKLGKKITVAGKLYSQGKVSLPNDHTDILMHLDKLNFIEIDAEKKLVRCGSGATWKQIQDAANEHALAVRVMQASNIFSVGGSLSINCHGWDYQTGSLSETVLSLKVMNSDGEILTLRPDDELFHLVLGGVGGFGIILEAEISLTDNSILTYEGVEVAPENYIDYFKTIANDPNMELHYYRLSLEPGKLFQEGVAANYKKAGPPVVSSLLDEHRKGAAIDRIKLQTLRRLKWLHNFGWQEEKQEALVSISTTRNKAMRPPILAITSESNLDVEWLQEYFIKPRHLAEFIKKLGAILDKNQVPVLNASVRYVARNSSESFNYAPNGNRFAIVLFFNQSLDPTAIQKTKSWIQETVDLLGTMNGSYYLPYQSFPTVEQFRKSYPNWKHVKRMKEKWDPDHVFANGFFSDYVDATPIETKATEFQSLLNSQTGMRKETSAFIDNIFMQLETNRFLALMDDILKMPHLKDSEVYPILLSRIDEAKGNPLQNIRSSFTSLKALQNELADQVKSLLGDQELHNYVEIGYPGRMIKPLKKRLNLTGQMTVIHPQQSLADYLQSGFPSPVDRFVPLADYEPISAEKIPSNSVDLVSLFIGLHHIPEEKLQPFIRSIHRILRPGGSLILMDHDASTNEQKAFLSLVHSIFNAGTNVSATVEATEYRNFQSLEHWIDLLAQNDLIWDSQAPLVRKGDSTLNSLLILKKPENDLKQKETYRNGMNTYLTGPEWQIVRSAQNYSAFIEHTPFYSFPYFSEIGTFWKVYAKSWNAARCHYSFWEVATSEYNMMNTFIGVMTTIEYTVKGILSAPIRWYFTQDSIKEAATIHVMATLPSAPENPQIQIIEISDHIYHIEIPRYKVATTLLQELSLSGADFLSIAGQTFIQADFIVDTSTPTGILPQGKWLYTVPHPTLPTKAIAAYEIPIPLLAETIRSLPEKNITLEFIHDF